MRSWSLGEWQTSGTAVLTNQKADLVLAIQCRSNNEIADLVLALTTLYCETYQNIVCVCDAECCTEHTQHSMLCMFSAALSITDANLCEHRPLIPCEYGVLFALVCQCYLDSPNLDSPNLDGRQLSKDMNILIWSRCTVAEICDQSTWAVWERRVENWVSRSTVCVTEWERSSDRDGAICSHAPIVSRMVVPKHPLMHAIIVMPCMAHWHSILGLLMSMVCCLQCCCLQCFDTVDWVAGRASGL